MKKVFLIFFSVIISLLFLYSFARPLHADNSTCDVNHTPTCTDATDSCIAQYSACVNTLNTALQMSVNATRPLESQLENLQNQITTIKNNIASIQSDIIVKQKNIEVGYQHLSKQEQILYKIVRDFYIKSYFNSPLLILLSSNSGADVTEALAYQKAATNQDKEIITNIVLSIEELKTRKTQLEQAQQSLSSLSTQLNSQSAKLNTVIQGAKAYQTNLNNQISQLSSQQQALLARKLASLNIPQTAYAGIGGGCSSDLTNGRNPGFSPKFGLFTYGVPHRVGMSQYGALGRAEAGQSYQDILNAYYSGISFVNVGTGNNVTVNGTNDYGESFSNQSMNVEDYLKHIYEMPSGWNQNALEAQAIAARSYVMHAIDNHETTVAPNQSFQEIKTELNAQSWIDAVNATSGIVMENGGAPIEAFFSSTAGGYMHSTSDVWGNNTPYTKTGVDASGSVNNFSDLTNNAYDGPNHANSPWFYCDWGARSQYDGTAWLQASEMADIVNVVMLAGKDSSTIPHLSQLDSSNPDGTDTWDPARVRQELQNRGITPYSNITSMSVNADFGSGRTTSVSVTGDAGSTTLDPTNFKNFFNLRAPANIEIVGPLYNIEMR